MNAPQPWVQQALARNDRYLLEFIEALNLCPYAKGCREQGRLHREVLDLEAADPAAIASRVAAIEAMPAEQIEVALLILPKLQLGARELEHLVSAARRIYEAGRTTPPAFFMVGFHPELKMDLANPDRAVGFLRRSPDPTVQLVRVAAIERAREGARDGKELSRIIAEAGLAAVLEAGPERLAALLAEIHRDRR